MKKFTYIFMVLVLVGCSQHITDEVSINECFNTLLVKNNKIEPQICPEEKEKREYKNNFMKMIVSGKLFLGKNDESIVLTTNPFNIPKNNEDYSIYIYENSSPCTPAQIGISSPILKETKNAEYRMWGEVDEKNDGSFSEPNCRVKSVYPHKNPYEQMTAYAFCSQKEEKTVLICISQMTDNPKLAEEIFSTFKWLP